MCLSMLMAVILTSGIRGAKFFKAAIYMPNIISAVALATMWIQYVFNYDYGLLNQIVKAFGGENVRWLGTDLIFWAMMIAFIFGSVGYYMLIFISGIEGIPQDLYEAATIDGANIFDRFFQITLPLLKGVIRTCVTSVSYTHLDVYKRQAHSKHSRLHRIAQLDRAAKSRTSVHKILRDKVNIPLFA